MTIPDAVNGIFESVGGFFIMLSCIKAWRAKLVVGISFWTVFFFTSWGFWNLYYYPHLDQMFSFAGGVFLVAMNTLWIGLVIKYGRK